MCFPRSCSGGEGPNLAKRAANTKKTDFKSFCQQVSHGSGIVNVSGVVICVSRGIAVAALHGARASQESQNAKTPEIVPDLEGIYRYGA